MQLRYVKVAVGQRKKNPDVFQLSLELICVVKTIKWKNINLLIHTIVAWA